MNICGNKKADNVPDNLANVNNINDYFIDSIPSNTAPFQNCLSFYKNNVKSEVANKFSFSSVTPAEVLKTFSSITSNSVGLDQLSLRMLRLCLPSLAPYICHIINFCFEGNIVPSDWKQASIIPLPKVSNPVEYKDLRPISILPVLSKVIEKIINCQIKAHLEKYKILPDTQSGFRSGYSCTTALLTFTDDIISALDKNKLTVLVLLDYTKAFDTINHDILLATLSYIGFSSDAVTLINNYLFSRTQRVCLSGVVSNARELTRGVPQGSILGPLLFSIYICNLPHFIKNCHSHFYADDTQL